MRRAASEPAPAFSVSGIDIHVGTAAFAGAVRQALHFERDQWGFSMGPLLVSDSQESSKAGCIIASLCLML